MGKLKMRDGDDIYAGLGDDGPSGDYEFPAIELLDAGPVVSTVNDALEGPSFRWADALSVKAKSDRIHFSGKRYFLRPKDASSRDLLSQYLAKISSTTAGDEQRAPHYLFANAKNDDNLLSFLERFGPVSIDPASLKIQPLHGEEPGVAIEATQSWENVRREHKIFGLALTLCSQARSQQPNPTEILTAARSLVSRCTPWADQFIAELAVERQTPRLAGDPRWIWDSARLANLSGHVSAIESASSALTTTIQVPASSKKAAKRTLQRLQDTIRDSDSATVPLIAARTHQLICAFLNAFPPTITRFNGETVEAVSENVALGTRHLLYFMLRSDYLGGGRVAVCAWPSCLKWFRLGYKDSPCCPEHRLQYSQKKYYDEGGGQKRRRARYMAQKRASKLPRKTGRK